jgi:two-component SAPR family response regulator
VHREGADLPDIMEAMWPTATLRRAAQRLSTETADLRRRIRHAADDPSIQPVVNTGGRYHLDPALLDIDLWQFTDALHRARTADANDHAALLRHAIALHTGTLAQGYDYEWIEPVREHLRRCAIRARLDLAKLLADHDPASAADLIQAAAALDPINENLTRRALRALAETGNTAGMAAVLQQLREALDDIEEEPSEETLALARQLQHPDG